MPLGPYFDKNRSKFEAINRKRRAARFVAVSLITYRLTLNLALIFCFGQVFGVYWYEGFPGEISGLRREKERVCTIEKGENRSMESEFHFFRVSQNLQKWWKCETSLYVSDIFCNLKSFFNSKQYQIKCQRIEYFAV